MLNTHTWSFESLSFNPLAVRNEFCHYDSYRYHSDKNHYWQPRFKVTRRRQNSVANQRKSSLWAPEFEAPTGLPSWSFTSPHAALFITVVHTHAHILTWIYKTHQVLFCHSFDTVFISVLRHAHSVSAVILHPARLEWVNMFLFTYKPYVTRVSTV